ncbi:MAG: glycosyltransferase family 4 protein [Nitrososphaeraceae archaeon]|nr:glycosyltransferase family 4 protein [Nitrososphaeraceae archaeon]
MKTNSNILLIFGYPSKLLSAGGLVWTKRVADYIDKNQILTVKKISNDIVIGKSIVYCIIRYMQNALKGFFADPDVAILDSYGEANLILWILLRIFKPRTKILTVFHHYEPRALPCKNTHIPNILKVIYNRMIDKATKTMIRDSNRVLTVSISSARQLNSIFGISNNGKKVVVVGASVDAFPVYYVKRRDIDFLCIGRIEKFEGLEEIWKSIKERHSKANFVVIGRASQQDIARLRSLGIDHKGVVSEREKIELYSRAQVFIFPSTMEGFGIAVAEALYAGLSVVSWKLPVFDEMYGEFNEKVKLIDLKNYDLFAQECVTLLKRKHRKLTANGSKIHFEMVTTWENVGKKVMSVIEDLESQ